MTKPAKANPHSGGSSNDFFKEDGIIYHELLASRGKARYGETVLDEFDIHSTPPSATNSIEAFRGQGSGGKTALLLADREKSKIDN
jgi:hypothetical protein